MLLLSPQEKLKNYISELNDKGYPIKLASDRGGVNRAVYSTTKSKFDIELIIIRGTNPSIRIAYRSQSDREDMLDIVVPLLRKQRLFKDSKLSTENFPTYKSEQVVEDFERMVSVIEDCKDLTDSSQTWKVNGGLESGTRFIVRSIMMAAELNHSSALGREMYESIRDLVSINKYDREAGLTWGEHLAPIDWLNSTGYDLAKCGASEDELYNFIITFHKVAYITPDEAAQLDSVYKTTMPENATGPMARLDEVGISVKNLI